MLSQEDRYCFKEIFDSIFGLKMINPESNYRAVKITGHHIYWQADCTVKYNSMTVDGTYIVSTDDGRILSLKLYHGSNRISTDAISDQFNNA